MQEQILLLLRKQPRFSLNLNPKFQDEAESARQKNRDNLQQTQEGIKAFKDQVNFHSVSVQ
jgi:hypothetical protein